MTYPKENLTPGVDPAGTYLCEFKLRAYSLREIWWDGRDYWWDSGHGTLAEPEPSYTNFRPLSFTPAAPEVVEGPAELPAGGWLVRLPRDIRSYWESRADDPVLLKDGETALRIPDAWLAVLKAKPKPVVTDKHREAAKKLAEVSPDDDAALLREYERILAENFPAEAVK